MSLEQSIGAAQLTQHQAPQGIECGFMQCKAVNLACCSHRPKEEGKQLGKLACRKSLLDKDDVRNVPALCDESHHVHAHIFHLVSFCCNAVHSVCAQGGAPCGVFIGCILPECMHSGPDCSLVAMQVAE